MKTVLITGGAGSLGKELVDLLVERGVKVRALDNNESRLAALRYNPQKFTHIYGDVRDYTRIHYAMVGCDTIIHTAAMKNLEITEGDVPELCLTNVTGTVNAAKAAIECRAKCAILISTDKAVSPLSAYGASKLLAEEVWKWAGRTQDKTRFAIFRSGNFKQSAGNVLEVWARQHLEGQALTVTDPQMERYFIDTRAAAEIVADMPGWVQSEDIVVPKMRKWNILDLLQEEFPGDKYRVIGSRQGEKEVEKLLMDYEKVRSETDKVMVV